MSNDSYLPIAMFTVKTDTVVFQSSLKTFLKNFKNQETVFCDEITSNEGNSFNKTSGIFTAPFDEIYSFTWTTLKAGGNYFITEIVRNRHPNAYNHNDGRGVGGEGYPMSSSYANIKMKKGERVWIRTHDSYGQYAEGGNWSNFSGIKL